MRTIFQVANAPKVQALVASTRNLHSIVPERIGLVAGLIQKGGFD